MEYIIRKYCDEYERGKAYLPCCGVLGKYTSEAAVNSDFWEYQIARFRSEMGIPSRLPFDSKYEREALVDYIQDRYPFYNEYYEHDQFVSLQHFNIPQEITDEQIKELSLLTNLFYYKIIKFENEVELYVPITDRTRKDFNGNAKAIDFSYFGEDNYGTCAYAYESIARFETEKFLMNVVPKTEDLSNTYQLLKFSYQEYLDFRFDELSETIIGMHAHFKCVGMNDIMELLSGMFQLPMEFLEEKLIL